jgi:hypothetical protein
METPRQLPPRPSRAVPLTTYAQIERMSEPWALNRTLAIIVTLVLAVVMGVWAANGEVENIILLVVLFGSVMIIVFVEDYWWSPALVIAALGFTTSAAGFPMSGMEIGVVILALTFPVKLAMKTLRKAEPELSAGIFYWALLGFIVAHAAVILLYNKIEGVPSLKNIVRSYYNCLTPLVYYGLLIRYCHPRTIRPTVIAIFFVTLFVVTAAMCSQLLGVYVESLTSLQINLAWLDAQGVQGVLRMSGPALFIGGLAFWPNVRPGWGRVVVTFGSLVGILGTLISGGRLSTVTCLAAGMFFAFVRGKIWVAIPCVLVAALVSGAITAIPELNYHLPETIQRSLGPLNFSEQKTEIQSTTEGSDDWHRDLRNQSLDYWLMDTTSFWIGHGFKSWDQSLGNLRDTANQVDREHMAELAIEMGITENMFSAITNIFGMTGLVLYGLFLGGVAWTLYKVCRIAPVGTDARALCEYSLINLLAQLVFCAFDGGVPGSYLFYWIVGILAARSYLAEKKPAAAAEVKEVPAFARPALAQRPHAPLPGRFRPGKV